MQDPGFIVTFPLYLIVDPSKGGAPLVAISEDEDKEELRGVAMFTEALFAERTRNAQAPTSEIWTVPTLKHLQAEHLPRYREWGYRYVSIDTHEHTGRGSYIPIEDLE